MCIGLISCNTEKNDDPLSACTVSNVTAINLKYGTHDYALRADEREDVLALLNEFKVLKKSDVIKDSDGDDFWYMVITLKPDQKMIVDLASPHIIVNEAEYKAENEPCTKLQTYIESIIEREFKK